jgi:hypothetical protein
VIHASQELARVREEVLPGVRQSDPALGPLEKADVDLPFELADLEAEWGLRDVQSLNIGALTETPAARGGVAQLNAALRARLAVDASTASGDRP